MIRWTRHWDELENIEKKAFIAAIIFESIKLILIIYFFRMGINFFKDVHTLSKNLKEISKQLSKDT